MSEESHLDDNLYPLFRNIHDKHVEFCERHLSAGAVLEIGCGKNPIVFDSRDDKYALDPVSKDLSTAREKYADCQYVSGIGNELPFRSKTVGNVVMRGVVHHLPGDERQHLFEEVSRVLQPGGSLIVIEPDPTGKYRRLIWSIADLIGYTHEESPHVETDGWVTPSEMRTYAAEAGLTVETSRGLGSLVAPLAYFYPFQTGAHLLTRCSRFLPVDWWHVLVARLE